MMEYPAHFQSNPKKMKKNRPEKKQFSLSILVTAVSSMMMSVSYTHAYAADDVSTSQPMVTGQQQNDTKKGVNSSDKSKQTGAEKSQKDDDIHTVLDALHLKKAVEKGIVDPSVLHSYQQNTIQQSTVQQSVVNKSTDNQSIANNSATNFIDDGLNTKTDNSDIANLDKIGQEEALTTTQTNELNNQLNIDKQTEQITANLDKQNVDKQNSDEADITQQFAEQLKQQALQEQQAGHQMLSPSELDSELASVSNLLQQSDELQVPVARLDDSQPPIGLDSQLDTASLPAPSNRETLGLADSNMANLNEGMSTNTTVTDTHNTSIQSSQSSSQTVAQTGQTAQEVAQSTSRPSTIEINPDKMLPDYQAPSEADVDKDDAQVQADNDIDPNKIPRGNIFKRIYNRLFNDGYEGLPHIESTVYLQQTAPSEQSDKPAKLIKADDDIEPFKNIKAALDDITIQSIADFTSALPRLRQTALDAAKAVGYYDVSLRLRQPSIDKIDVVIEQLGEPVMVANRVLDIRGQGSEMEDFQAIEKFLPPLKGEVFNSGVYKESKATIESLSSNLGFFDRYWLNSSVDIILPDNTADVDLIYNTGERYKFGDVVFYTYDKQNKQLTTDPKKLPVRLDLLQQLVGFKAGDPYYRPFITKFSNNLSATRYFNTLNIDVVTPPDDVVDRAVLSFDGTANDNTSSGGANDSTLKDKDSQDDINVADGRKLAGTELENKSLGGQKTDNQTTETLSGQAGHANQDSGQNTSQDTSQDTSQATENAAVTDDADIAPIEFKIGEQTQEKQAAIERKAERLLSLPDDRVLNEGSAEAKNLLGKISDGISHIAGKIFPDNDADFEDVPASTTLPNRVTPEQVEESKRVPLYVYVDSEKPRDAQFGIGYGTDTGVRATAKIDYNLINKDGYQAGLSTAISRINKNVTVYGSRPWKHPLTDTLNTSLSYEEKELNEGKGNFDLSTRSLKASLSRNIHRESGWNRRFSLSYRLDELETGVDVSQLPDLPVRFTSSKPKQQALLLGYGLNKLSADDLTNPSKGFYQSYSLELGSKHAVSDSNMAILQAGVAGIYSFGEEQKPQVIGRLNTGYIWSDSFYDVPYNLRFFAGGEKSIRGYDYNSLSPLKNGYLTGGQALAVGSLEFNYEVKPGIRAAVFTDFGNAYDKDLNNPTKVGAGVGVRWASPVGLVSVDVAAGLSEEDKPIRLYFFIGSPL